MYKTLLFSTLFPNSIKPRHGIFVASRLGKLLESGKVQTKVVAPVPWFPFKTSIFGQYSDSARIPKEERAHGIDVFHPRYYLLPKVGMNIAPYSLYKAGLANTLEIIKSGYDFDLIDAHYFYPDGVSAVHMGEKLSKPVVITARGSDINLICQYANSLKSP